MTSIEDEYFTKRMVRWNCNRCNKWDSCIFLTQWVMKRIGKVKYYKQVDDANHSIINLLKPYIAGQGLPDIDIFKALISATSRRFGVNLKDLYTVDVFCEELIREVISDVYASNEQKKEYTNLLAEYKRDFEKENLNIYEITTNKTTAIYTEKMNRRLSFLMASLTAIITMCSLLLTTIGSEGYIMNDKMIILVPVMAIVLMTLLLVITMQSESLFKSLRDKKGLNMKESN